MMVMLFNKLFLFKPYKHFTFIHLKLIINCLHHIKFLFFHQLNCITTKGKKEIITLTVLLHVQLFIPTFISDYNSSRISNLSNIMHFPYCTVLYSIFDIKIKWK